MSETTHPEDEPAQDDAADEDREADETEEDGGGTEPDEAQAEGI